MKYVIIELNRPKLADNYLFFSGGKIMDYLLEGVRALVDFGDGGWKSLVMFAVGIVLIWLAIS